MQRLVIKDKNLISWLVCLTIIVGSSLYKLLNISYDYQFRFVFITCSALAICCKLARVQTKYISRLLIYVLLLNVIEVIYTLIKYNEFTFRSWIDNNVLSNVCLLFLTPIILQYWNNDTVNFNKTIKMIVNCTFISYLVRIYIQIRYMNDGMILYPGIAYESASLNWTRNSILRINPPAFVALFIPFCYYLMINERRIIKKIVYGIMIGVSIWFSVNVHMSRSALIYQVLTILLIIILQRRGSRKQLFVWGAITIILIFIVNSSYMDAIDNLIASFFDYSASNTYGDTTSARLYAMAYFQSWMSKNPILGIGALSNNQLSENLLIGHISDLGVLGDVFRYGLLGVILIFVYLGKLLKSAISQYKFVGRNEANRILVIGIVISTIMFSINMDCFSTMLAIAAPFTIAIIEYFDVNNKLTNS